MLTTPEPDATVDRHPAQDIGERGQRIGEHGGRGSSPPALDARVAGVPRPMEDEGDVGGENRGHRWRAQRASAYCKPPSVEPHAVLGRAGGTRGSQIGGTLVCTMATKRSRRRAEEAGPDPVDERGWGGWCNAPHAHPLQIRGSGNHRLAGRVGQARSHLVAGQGMGGTVGGVEEARRPDGVERGRRP